MPTMSGDTRATRTPTRSGGGLLDRICSGSNMRHVKDPDDIIEDTVNGLPAEVRQNIIRQDRKARERRKLAAEAAALPHSSPGSSTDDSAAAMIPPFAAHDPGTTAASPPSLPQHALDVSSGKGPVAVCKRAQVGQEFHSMWLDDQKLHRVPPRRRCHINHYDAAYQPIRAAESVQEPALPMRGNQLFVGPRQGDPALLPPLVRANFRPPPPPPPQHLPWPSPDPAAPPAVPPLPPLTVCPNAAPTVLPRAAPTTTAPPAAAATPHDAPPGKPRANAADAVPMPAMAWDSPAPQTSPPPLPAAPLPPLPSTSPPLPPPPLPAKGDPNEQVPATFLNLQLVYVTQTDLLSVAALEHNLPWHGLVHRRNFLNGMFVSLPPFYNLDEIIGHDDKNITTRGGAIVALKPGNFGRDPIVPDQAKAVNDAIVAGRRPPLKRAQVALTSYVLHYARRWANQAVEAAFLQGRAVTPHQQQRRSSAEQQAAESRDRLLQDAESALLATSEFWVAVQETVPSSTSGGPLNRSVSSNDEEISKQAGLPQMLQAVGRDYAEGLKIQQERWLPERRRSRPTSRSRSRGRSHRRSKARHTHRGDRRHRSRHHSRGWSPSLPPQGRRLPPDYSPFPPRSRRRWSRSLSPGPPRKRRHPLTYSPLPPRSGRWVSNSPSLDVGLGTHSGASKRNSRSRGRIRSRHRYGGGSGRSQTATSRKHAHHRKRGSHKQRGPSRRDSGYLPTTVVQPEASAVCSPTQRTGASPGRPPQPDQAPALSCTGAKPSKMAVQRQRTSAERHKPVVKLPHLTDEASNGSLGAGMADGCSFGMAAAATEAATEVAVAEAAATEVCPAPTEVTTAGMAATEAAAAKEIVLDPQKSPHHQRTCPTTDIITEAATGE